MAAKCLILTLTVFQRSIYSLVQAEQVKVTVQALAPLRLQQTVLMCCSSQQWGGIVPELRLKVSPEYDFTHFYPPQAKSGDFEYCYNISVAVKHHLREALCVAIFRSRSSSVLEKSFNVSVTMKVFQLNNMRVSQPARALIGARMTWICEVEDVTYDSNDEFNMTQKLFDKWPAEVLDLRIKDTPLDYVDKERKVLRRHKVVSELDFRLTSSMTEDLTPLPQGCHFLHAFNRPLQRAATFNNISPFPPPKTTSSPNIAAVTPLAETSKTPARFLIPELNTPFPQETSTAEERDLDAGSSTQQLATYTAIAGGVSAFVGLVSFLITALHWAKNRKKTKEDVMTSAEEKGGEMTSQQGNKMTSAEGEKMTWKEVGRKTPELGDRPQERHLTAGQGDVTSAHSDVTSAHSDVTSDHSDVLSQLSDRTDSTMSSESSIVKLQEGESVIRLAADNTMTSDAGSDDDILPSYVITAKIDAGSSIQPIV